MTYDQQILKILTEVGERGISVAALIKHVYNENTSFFFQPDLQEVAQYVRNYLRRNSLTEQSMIERTDRRGYYRLNNRLPIDKQLLLSFRDDDSTENVAEVEPPQQDFSLSLFPDDCF